MKTKKRKGGGKAGRGAPSAGEAAEMKALGIRPGGTGPARRKAQFPRTAIKAPDVLNEATDYRPVASAFSRGFRVPMGCGRALLLISGTASVDRKGNTLHGGDFRAQMWRTLRNITRLLASEGATWHDIIRTTCYVRDIERDYTDFNEVRNLFFKAMKVDPVPASTAIQARICRSDLLVEIEAMALVRDEEEGCGCGGRKRR